MKQKYVFVLIPVYCLLPFLSRAQTAPADSAFGRQVAALLVQSYKKQTAENLHLYNGSEYVLHGHGVKGFPFFQSATPLNGSVFYDGNLYEDTGLQYDLEEDNLVISDYSGNYPICLVKDKIGYFNIDGHRFVRLLSGEGLPSPGFYESLYSGKLNAWAKKLKKPISLDASGSDASYHAYASYFIEKQGVFYPVDKERSVLAVLNDKKDVLKKFIRSNKLSYKKDPELFLTRVAEYYTQQKD